MKQRELQVICRSEEETVALGERLGQVMRAGDVVALHGELGAGKTRLVRGIARGLGLDPNRVSSPTYVLVNVYEPLLVHVDAYRLHGTEDLPALGWDRLTDGSKIVVIEWAERVGDALPAQRVDVWMEHVDETTRRVRAVDRTSRGIGLAAIKPDGAVPGSARCRTCGKSLPAGAQTSPFCSDRCRMADLGKWFGEQYKISRPIEQRDIEEGV